MHDVLRANKPMALYPVEIQKVDLDHTRYFLTITIIYHEYNVFEQNCYKSIKETEK